MKACIIPASRKPSSRYGDISLSRCIISCISFILYGQPAPARQCALSSAKIITIAEMSRACECHRLPRSRCLRPRAEEGKVLSPAGHYRVQLPGEKRISSGAKTLRIVFYTYKILISIFTSSCSNKRFFQAYYASGRRILLRGYSIVTIILYSYAEISALLFADIIETQTSLLWLNEEESPDRSLHFRMLFQELYFFGLFVQ